ncbi:MAG: AAA family ATPase, partial [Deltaproteobacteria bacterium]|nr:AAA family ATPase [Deltaproteobacteria bacterium]
MTETPIIKNPFGVNVESFKLLIDSHRLYVDKTGLIHDLIYDPEFQVPIFLSRPRRFGKTLLLDTIQRIFEGKRELFSGLEIEKRLGSKWDIFPVIRISFNGIPSDPAQFKESLLLEINNIALRSNIALRAVNPTSAISELIVKLSTRHQSVCQQKVSDRNSVDERNVVLLIDEYDFPLIGNIGYNRELESIRL